MPQAIDMPYKAIFCGLQRMRAVAYVYLCVAVLAVACHGLELRGNRLSV